MTRPALAPAPVTAASVLALVQAIERHGPEAPAAIAFRSALRRKGIEADAAGGLQALDTLMDEIAEADPERADARTALLRCQTALEWDPGSASNRDPIVSVA